MFSFKRFKRAPIINIVIRIYHFTSAKSWGRFIVICLRAVAEHAKMFDTTDLCLGVFLILCGFAMSLFNLRRVVKGSTAFSSVLLSENIILMCIGIAFISRSVYSINPVNVEIYDVEERTAELASYANNVSNCGFISLLLGYGPLVVSMVNSFLSLIIDNYMHYRMLGDVKQKSEENVVRELNEDVDSEQKCTDLRKFWKKYFSPVTIALQWIVPILIAISMYPMGVKEISMSHARSMDESCLAMLDLTNNECDNGTDSEHNTWDLPKYFQSPIKFLEAHESSQAKSNDSEINSVLSSVLDIINNFTDHSNFNFTAIKSARRPKFDMKCMKMCYTDNKRLLLYMFVLAFVSYFIPITISTILLMKIHNMDIQKSTMKSNITRELLYNILFWTPVMFDTFLSLVFCAYSMHGVRTSMFNVVANIYQAVKNFMNTKYFKENVVVPV